MPLWTKSDTPCKRSESGQAGDLAAYVVTPSSIHVTVAGIVAVVVVLATMALEAAQQVEIGLVEYDPEQIVVYARRHPERMFHHVDLCAPPFDHEHKRIDEVRHGANVHHRRQWRQINDDVLVSSAEPLEQDPCAFGGEHLAAVSHALVHDGR